MCPGPKRSQFPSLDMIYFILLFLGAFVGLGVSLPYDGLSGGKTIAIDYPRSLGTP